MGGIISRSGRNRLQKDPGTGYHFFGMSCQKGKSKAKPKPGRFRCEDCGAVVKKKSDVCDPKKVKKT